MNRTRPALLMLAFLLPAAPTAGQEERAPDDPERNFEHLWHSLDRNYAQFGAKRVDWDGLYRVYRPQVTARTTEEELFDRMLALVSHLNDAHVCVDPGGRRTCSGIADRHTMDDFSLDLVRSAYLGGQFATAVDGRLSQGWLGEPGGLAYLHVLDFKFREGVAEQAIDAFLAEYGDAAGMIIDVRDNTGGRGACCPT